MTHSKILASYINSHGYKAESLNNKILIVVDEIYDEKGGYGASRAVIPATWSAVREWLGYSR